MSSVTNGMFSPKTVIGAAIMGLIGAAGMFLIEQIYNDRRRVVLAQDLARLDRQVASMKAELDNLKDLQAQYIQKSKHAQSKRPPKHLRKSSANNVTDNRETKIVPKNYTSDTEYNTEYNSAMGTDYDVSSEEFYDMSSDTDREDDEKAEIVENGKKAISTEDEIICKVDNMLLNGSEENVENAFDLLKDLKETLLCPENGIVNNTLVSEVMWRMGKCCQRKSNVCEKHHDAEGKKAVIIEGIAYCKEAVERDLQNAEAHKWYAILVGLRSDFSGTRDRITDGVIFKDHVEEALRLNPNDATLYHLIGRFKLELSNLSWLERKIASTLFAEIPLFNFDDALQEFEKAEELSTIQWKENRLLIAKCYVGKGEYATAVDWLDRTVSIPSKTSDDQIAEREAQTLLSKYSGYRRSDEIEE